MDGFFDKYAKEMEKAKEGSLQILFMADNLFISQKKEGKIKFLSLDGKKMECSHDEKDVLDYLEFFESQW